MTQSTRQREAVGRAEGFVGAPGLLSQGTAWYRHQLKPKTDHTSLTAPYSTFLYLKGLQDSWRGTLHKGLE